MSFAAAASRRRLLALVAAALTAALVCAATLPPGEAMALTGLAAAMIAGAEHDHRTFLLPDWTTLGTAGAGIAAAGAGLQTLSLVEATGGALACAIGLAALRWGYGLWREREGLGLGDVKLAAAAGAWVPFATIPACLLLACTAALAGLALKRLRGLPVPASERVPFGSFLCPSIWLSAYVSSILS